MRITSRNYRTGLPISIEILGGIIHSVTPSDVSPDNLTSWIAPGLFDLQINGALGISFNSPDLTLESVRKVACHCLSHGITSFCPTLVTASLSDLSHGLSTLAKGVREDRILGMTIPGYHLEGPWINPEDGPRGAHPGNHVQKPDWETFRRLQDLAEGKILLVTLAPELEGAIPLIEKLVASGVVVAIGHTAANEDDILKAIKAGASLSTHLGNGCHRMMHRHANPLWPQLASDQLWMSLITDSHHLPLPVLHSFIRAKSLSRTLITCDASSLAGMPPGKYESWSVDVEILPEGKIVVVGTEYLAGSAQFTDQCLSVLLSKGGFSLAEAIPLATTNPRLLLRQKTIDLVPESRADLILFEWKEKGEMAILSTILQGEVVWQNGTI